MIRMIKRLVLLVQDYIALRTGKVYNYYNHFHGYDEYKRLVHIMFRKYDNSSTIHRNIIAALTKASRRVYPFIVNKEWISNRLEYEKYLEMDNGLKSYSEVFDRRDSNDLYLVKFRGGGYHPGERYAEYTSGTWSYWEDGDYVIYKVDSSDDDADWVYLEGIDGSIGSIGKDDWTAFRYASKEEIESYDRRKDVYNEFEVKIEELTAEFERTRGMYRAEMNKVKRGHYYV